MTGDEPADKRPNPPGVKTIQRAKEAARLSELENDDAAARTRHAPHLGQRFDRIVDVANAKRYGRDVERGISEPQIHCVTNFERQVLPAIPAARACLLDHVRTE